MKCDFCGEEYQEYELERRMFAKGKTRYICYKCRNIGNYEVKKLKVDGMIKKGLIGEK